MRHRKVSREIRMVMADVDGTLVNSEKILTERARQTTFQLRAAGFKFTICSSRPPYGLSSLVRDLQLDEPVVAFNGGMLINPSGAVLHQHFLPAKLIPAILECLGQYGLSPRLYMSERWLIESLDQPYAQHEAHTIKTEPTLVQDFSPYLKCILKLTGVSEDYSAVARCQEAMQKLLSGQVSAVCSEPYYLDITHRLANKGHAVDMMARIQKISKKEIAVIGDMPSDVPMFREAGLSIAMGNASDEVKQQADYVTGTNTAEGFAKAMESYILKKVSTIVQ